MLANSQFALDVLTDHDEQQKLLDELIFENVGSARVLGSWLRMVPFYFPSTR